MKCNIEHQAHTLRIEFISDTMSSIGLLSIILTDMK